MRLLVQFFDAKGRLIEKFVTDLGDATERIMRFVELHGTDPDEDGKDAMAGSIRFEPAK